MDRVRLQKAGGELIDIIKSSKENFYNLAKELKDRNTSNKTYWSITKAFINSKNSYYPTIIGQ